MLAIDHVVMAAHDPEQAAQHFGAKHNVAIVEGSRHAEWGTYNVLAYLKNDCYSELLGMFDEQKAKQSSNPLIQQLVQRLEQEGDGPFQYALRTNRMPNVVNHLQSAHLSFEGPIKGSRTKPDGTQLSWHMLFPTGVTTDSPFVIEWGGRHNRPDDPSSSNQQQLRLLRNRQENLDMFNDNYQTT